MVGKVSSLDHEAGDDPVEGGAGVTEAPLPGAERPEVLRRLRNGLVLKLDVYAAQRLSIHRDVQGAELAAGGVAVTPAVVTAAAIAATAA